MNTSQLPNVPGGWHAGRLALLADVPENARIIVCGDEKTGVRFGKAKCRVGRCKKIGTGGHRRGAYAYQIWADWS